MSTSSKYTFCRSSLSWCRIGSIIQISMARNSYQATKFSRGLSIINDIITDHYVGHFRPQDAANERVFWWPTQSQAFNERSTSRAPSDGIPRKREWSHHSILTSRTIAAFCSLVCVQVSSAVTFAHEYIRNTTRGTAKRQKNDSMMPCIPEVVSRIDL